MISAKKRFKNDNISNIFICPKTNWEYGSCTKYWELYKILGTGQNIGNCTKYWELYKILGNVQNIVN